MKTTNAACKTSFAIGAAIIVVLLSTLNAAFSERSASDVCNKLAVWSNTQSKDEIEDVILKWSECIKESQKARVGKYFCHINHMVGIQVNSDNTIFAGKIKPDNDKFVITISERGPVLKKMMCDWSLGFALPDLLYDKSNNLCVGNFDLEFFPNIGASNIYSAPDSYRFRGEWSYFYFGDDNSFTHFDVLGSYFSMGKCEKIN